MSGPDLSSQDQSSKQSTASTSTTTSIADSYNSTRYDTQNIADSGNVSLAGERAVLHSGAGDLFQDSSNIGNSAIGNVSYGAGGSGISGGTTSGLDLTKWLPWIIGGIVALAVLKMITK